MEEVFGITLRPLHRLRLTFEKCPLVFSDDFHLIKVEDRPDWVITRPEIGRRVGVVSPCLNLSMFSEVKR